MDDAKRLHSVMRGSPPCKDCEERHTACWDRCPKYKAWKAEAEKVKETRKAYQDELLEAYKERNRRQAWRRKTF